MTKRLIFIGGGNIAQAMITPLIHDFNITVIQRNHAKAQLLQQKFNGITVTDSLSFLPNRDDIVILCVKPQDAKSCCTQYLKMLDRCIILSVMTGITVATLSSWLNNDRVIRAMPNTPLTIGMGVTGIYYPSQIDQNIRDQVNHIFSKTGIVETLSNEDDINKITAISGSAPGYIFYFLEAMQQVAVNQFGFNPDQAKRIVNQVIIGSSGMISSNPDLDFSELRASVTSKNGTTAAACNIFDQNNLFKIMDMAQKACYKRAIEISNQFS